MRTERFSWSEENRAAPTPHRQNESSAWPLGKLYEAGRCVSKNGSGRCRWKLILRTHISRLAPMPVITSSRALRRWPATQSATQPDDAAIDTNSPEPRSEKNCMATVSQFDEWACTNWRTTMSNWRVSPSSISSASPANNATESTAQAKLTSSGVRRRKSTGLVTVVRLHLVSG